MFQKLHQKHNRDKIMIHPLVFTAYFTEHCNSLTSSSNIQTCTNTTDRVPLPAFVIFLKFLLMSVCKMKILINLYTKVPGVLMVYSRCIPFVQFGKLKMWDGILFRHFSWHSGWQCLIMLVLIFVSTKTQQVTERQWLFRVIIFQMLPKFYYYWSQNTMATTLLKNSISTCFLIFQHE